MGALFGFLFFLGLWVGVSLLIGVIASKKGRSGASAVLVSILFSPLIGLLVVLALDDKSKNKEAEGPTKKCPYCAERIQVDALLCKHCRSTLPEPIPASVESEDKTKQPVFKQ